jgi:hypothetical protein
MEDKHKITLIIVCLLVAAGVVALIVAKKDSSTTTERSIIAANLFTNQYEGGIGEALGNLDLNKTIGLLGGGVA